MLTPAQFRENLPEFSDTTRYPDTSVQLHLDVASKLVNEERWGALYDTGVGWCAAHLITLATTNEETADKGRIPGQVQGIATAKAVDKVSKSMDVSSVTMADGGFWNMTTYGIKFLNFARLIGSGGLQL